MGTTSIQEKLALLVSNKTAIKSAIEAKNPSVLPTDAMSQWPEAIASIPSGGQSGSIEDAEEVDPYEIPEAWPDIRQIIASDEESSSYKNRMIVLVDGTLPVENIPVNGAQFYKFSDGTTATTSGYYSVPPMDDFPNFRWIIFASNNPITTSFATTPSGAWDYANGSPTQIRAFWAYGRNCEWRVRWYCLTNQPFFKVMDVDGAVRSVANEQGLPSGISYMRHWGTVDIANGYGLFCSAGGLARLPDEIDLHQKIKNAYRLFYACWSIAKVPDEIDVSECTNAASMFQECFRIRRVPAVLDVSKCTTVASMFQNCRSLVEVPAELDISQCTATNSMFNECASLKRVPEVLDISKSTNVSYMFYRCRSLVKAPDVLDCSSATNGSYMFNECSALDKVPDVLDTSKMTSVANMFYNCNSLKEVPDVLDFSSATNVNGVFGLCYSIRKVPSVLDISNSTSAAELFSTCYNLENVPDVLDLSKCTLANNMFYSCRSLHKVPETLDFSKCTNVTNVFAYCYSLERIPDTIDFGKATSASATFTGLFSLKRLPTHFTCNLSISFADCINVDPSSLAEFDSDGNIVGGMAYYINRQTSAHTLTLNATLCNKFTTQQKIAIRDHFSSVKNWTLSGWNVN